MKKIKFILLALIGFTLACNATEQSILMTSTPPPVMESTSTLPPTPESTPSPQPALEPTSTPPPTVVPPTATPTSAEPVSIIDQITSKLITESEANAFYRAIRMGKPEENLPGVWEFAEDEVYDGFDAICRTFKDRTNADARWVSFSDCIFSADKVPFEYFAQRYEDEGDVKLPSSYQYIGDFAIYGMQNENTWIRSLWQVDGFLYSVIIESRTPPGASAASLYDQVADNFIYKVLSINASR